MVTDWETRSLGGIATLQRGFDLPTRLRKRGRVPIVSSAGITDTHDVARVEPPGVITGRYGTIGEVFFLEEAFWPLNTTLYVRDFHGNDPRFIFYLLQRFDFGAFSGKSGVPGVNRNELHREDIRIPTDTREQSAISSVLSDVDELIAGLNRLVAKTADLKQAAMRQLLSGRIRLPGFTKTWTRMRLGDHVTYLSHATHARAVLLTEGSIRYLHYGDVHATRSISLDPRVTAMPFVHERLAGPFDRLETGDLVFVDASEDLTGIGKSVELRGVEDIEVIAGLHTITARFDKSVLADGFKGYLQFMPPFKTHLQRLAAGTKVYASNKSHVSSAEIELPGVEEQVAIAEAINDMAAEIAALEKRRDKTRLLKQGMMQQLLTGRIRLPLDQPVEAMDRRTA
jgi:type I restriction enzyme, S subunit